jgi:hypothetical protein
MSIPLKQSYTPKKKGLTSARKSAKITSQQPGRPAMAAMRQAEAVILKGHDRKLSGIGATEDQMNVRGAIPQRIDKKGTKIEDMAGTGQYEGSGG